MNQLNNRRMDAGTVLFEKGEPMDSKLVILIEGELETGAGTPIPSDNCAFINEEAFFGKKGEAFPDKVVMKVD